VKKVCSLHSAQAQAFVQVLVFIDSKITSRVAAGILISGLMIMITPDVEV